MTFDHIDRMVREANPVPDLSALEPVDSSGLLDQWRNDMQVDNTIERTERPVPDTRNRPPRLRWVGAMGAVAAIVVAAAVILPDIRGGILGGDSPVAVAERYMAARSALDAEAAVAEFSPDVELTEVPHMEDPGDVAEGFAYLAALDHELTEYGCSTSEEAMESEPVAVRCDYMFTTNLSQALEVEPIDGSITLLVEGGEIVRLFHDFNFDEYSSRVFEVFIAWLEESQPGIVDTMWSVAPGSNILVFNVTDENLAELERYITEFEQAQS